MKIFQEGTLLLDEVDMILHPLKSELNWPLGLRQPLAFTMPAPSTSDKPSSNAARMGAGMRWRVVIHLLDALFFCQTGRTTEDYQDSLAACSVLVDMKK
eukprot:1260616-Rhodomonas_salina.1